MVNEELLYLRRMRTVFLWERSNWRVLIQLGWDGPRENILQELLLRSEWVSRDKAGKGEWGQAVQEEEAVVQGQGMRRIAGGSVGLEWRPGGQGFSQRLVVSSSTDCHPLAAMYHSSWSWLGGGDWIILPLKEHHLIVVGGGVTLPLFTPSTPQERENLSLIMLYIYVIVQPSSRTTHPHLES